MRDDLIGFDEIDYERETINTQEQTRKRIERTRLINREPYFHSVPYSGGRDERTT